MSVFNFKQFSVDDAGCAMKVGTDSVLLGAWADLNGVNHALDIGAGSGLLSLMLAQRSDGIKVTGVEIDPLAAQTAESNFKASVWADRLHVINANIINFRPTLAPDLIITNPPYFRNSLRSPNRRRQEARHADESFGPLSAIEYAVNVLAPNGSIAMVTPSSYIDEITFLSEIMRIKVWRRCDVLTVDGLSPSRILWQLSLDRSKPIEHTTLTIRRQQNYTPEYKALTREFYINF